MNEEKKSEPKPTIAWCAKCKTGKPFDPWSVGARFRCEKAKVNDFHVAAVIPVNMKPWLQWQQHLVSWTDSKWHPRVSLFKEATAGYGVFLAFMIAVALFFPNAWPLAILVVVDLLLYSTRAAFITQHPQVPLRNATYGVIGFMFLALSFAALYLGLAADGFSPKDLTTFPAIYFSFVTLATLGYGDIYPKATATGAQCLVIAEILIGLFYVAAILVIVVAWANGPAKLPTLKQLEKQLEQDGYS